MYESIRNRTEPAALKRAWLIVLALQVSSAWSDERAPGVGRAEDPPLNLAASAQAVASSQKDAKHPASNANDGLISEGSRWLNARGAGPHWLELRFAAAFELGSAHVYSGWRGGAALRDFSLQYWSNGRWRPVPGGRLRDNPDEGVAVRVVFDRPVTTSRLRLLASTSDYARLAELAVFAPHPEGSPPLRAGVTVKQTGVRASVAPPDPTVHHVLANQAGFNAAWPKRFTAPISPDGSRFTVARVDDGAVVYEGKVKDQIGDFTPLLGSENGELAIRVEGRGKAPGVSFPFVVEPFYTQRMALDPALRFMIDCRSVIGTHPSAYGGHPWRDGTYYTYEVPSLVLLYLANPAFFEHAEVEIDYERERSRTLDPSFRLVKCPNDRDALTAARRYYQELDPPIGDRVPDLVQLLHWGIGYHLMDPANADPSGDPLPEQVHPQTVEQFAYFLYGLPHYGDYFTEEFRRRATDFAFEHWAEVGLLDVFTEIGDFKGRQPPGHSIAPNLMMHQVAKRAGRADAQAYLDAALAQAAWFLQNAAAGDPRVTRGQRMSEFKAMVGLFMLHRNHTDHLTAELREWLDDWMRHVRRRSDNLYDFRKFSDSLWTLPKPWSDPGSVAGFPGLAVMVKSMRDDREDLRLDQLKASHFDALFGRNPVGAASANKAGDAFPGLDRGWPRKYGDDICARLELCRGVLNTIAAHEHYPFNPQAKFRHPEGWSGFNAAFNVSLAFCCWDDATVSLLSPKKAAFAPVEINQPFAVVVRAPLAGAHRPIDALDLQVRIAGRPAGVFALSRSSADDNQFVGQTTIAELNGKPGLEVELSYGHGILRRSATLKSNAERWSWSNRP